MFLITCSGIIGMPIVSGHRNTSKHSRSQWLNYCCSWVFLSRKSLSCSRFLGHNIQWQDYYHGQILVLCYQKLPVFICCWIMKLFIFLCDNKWFSCQTQIFFLHTKGEFWIWLCYPTRSIIYPSPGNFDVNQNVFFGERTSINIHIYQWHHLKSTI